MGIMIEKMSKIPLESTMAATLSQTGLVRRSEI